MSLGVHEEELLKFSSEIVNAVLASNSTDMVALHGRMVALYQLTQSTDFSSLRSTFKRVMGLTKEHHSIAYSVKEFQSPAETTLHEQLIAVQDDVSTAIEAQRYYDALQSLGGLKESLFE